MALTFYGSWFVEVTGLDTAFIQRFVISGSESADGAYDGLPGIGVQASGEEWTIELEWNNSAGSGWRPSDIQRTATYTIDRGLTVTLNADDNVGGIQDRDFNDLVVTCTSLDPEINPPGADPPLDFTITDDHLRSPRYHQTSAPQSWRKEMKPTASSLGCCPEDEAWTNPRAHYSGVRTSHT